MGTAPLTTRVLGQGCCSRIVHYPSAASGLCRKQCRHHRVTGAPAERGISGRCALVAAPAARATRWPAGLLAAILARSHGLPADGYADFRVPTSAFGRPTLPKGLPVLGPTPVVVWCTPKQWAKVREGLTGTTRLIAEGEAALAQDADGVPVLRLVCLSLRTLDSAPAG